MIAKPKNFADCWLYRLTNQDGDIAEKQLVEFLIQGQRINYADSSFKPVRDALKSRVNAAVLYRLLQNGIVTLIIHNKRELPAAFKVFYATDPRSGSKRKSIFLDVTGLIYEQNGFFLCKDIDKFSAYLLGALAYYMYYFQNQTLMRNAKLQIHSVGSFSRLFCGILNYLRVPGYLENREKIQYITGVYYAVNAMQLDIKTARRVAAVAAKVKPIDAANYDYYYDEEDEFVDIDAFVTSLVNTFKLKGLNTSIMIDRWHFRYGKGTHFALELYPALLTTLCYAYCGDTAYLNNWRGIEAACDKDMLNAVNILIKLGSEFISGGFSYESANDRSKYNDMYLKEVEQQNMNNNNNSTSNNNQNTNTPVSKPTANNNDDVQEDKIPPAALADSGSQQSQNNNTSSTTNNNQSSNNNQIKKESTNLVDMLEDETDDINKITKRSMDYVIRQYPEDNSGKEAKQFIDDIVDDTRLKPTHEESDMADFDEIVKRSISNKDVPTAGEKDTYKDDIDKDKALQESGNPLKKISEVNDLKKQWEEKSKNFVTHRWIERFINKNQEEMLSKWFDVMNAEDVNYSDYRKAFVQICKFMGLPNKGIVLEWVTFKDDKEDKGQRKCAVRYSKGMATIKIPEDMELVHVSPAKELDGGALKPSFKGKSGGLFFYPSNRVFFTVDKEVDKWVAGTVGKKTYRYVTDQHFTTAYIDPACKDFGTRAVYIETDTPIKVHQQKDTLQRKISNTAQDIYYKTTRGKQLKDANDSKPEDNGIRAQRKIDDVKQDIKDKKYN